jgi:hypothetical protein
MSKTPRKASVKRAAADQTSPAGFEEVLNLIEAVKARALADVNTALIELYWNIGQHISRKRAEDGRGKGTVEELSEAIRRRYPTRMGFSARNLWRMMQLYET